MGPFLYCESNTTEEFVYWLDGKLRRINKVLEVKKDHIVTEDAKRRFAQRIDVGYVKEFLHQ
jgi:hypothetical protein